MKRRLEGLKGGQRGCSTRTKQVGEVVEAGGGCGPDDAGACRSKNDMIDPMLC